MVIAHRFPFRVACGADALDQVTMPGHPWRQLVCRTWAGGMVGCADRRE
jgi:hypothetical protein